MPRSLNQRVYLEQIAEERHGLRHRPRGHRQDLPGGGPGGLVPARQAGGPHRSWRARRSRRARSSASCPATCRRRSIPTCGRSTTRSTTCSSYEKVERLFERNAIEVAPIAFMRGRTLYDAFVIIDEAQNTTTEQMKMVLTRIGFGSKVVVTGDITQIDLPAGRISGLVEAISVLSGVEGHRLLLLRREGRGAAPAGAVDRQGLRALGRRQGRRGAEHGRRRSPVRRAAEPPAAAPRRARRGCAGCCAGPPRRCACAGELALVLAGDGAAARLNRDYRGKDKADRRAVVPGRRRGSRASATS